MNPLAPFVTLLALLAAITAGAGGANGSPYSPGLDYGWEGVRAPSGEVRYVTLGTPKSTMVAAISVRGGRVLRSRAVRGSTECRSSLTTGRRQDSRATGARSSSQPTDRFPATWGALASSL